MSDTEETWIHISVALNRVIENMLTAQEEEEEPCQKDG